MDTTETYIKMCEKAKEIQPYLGDDEGVGGTWVGGSILHHLAPMNQPHDRDGYYHITDTEAIRKCETCGHEEPYIKSTKAIWLPRQDQLQEMVRGEYDPYCGAMLSKLMRFFNKIMSVYPSMEQLWLAFVMKEKYDKV